jgi:hypothetical protein
LDLPPNLCDSCYRSDFGGQLSPGNADRRKSPFRAGVRSGSELRARLLLASAPLPRKTQSRGSSAKKRTIFQIAGIRESNAQHEKLRAGEKSLHVFFIITNWGATFLRFAQDKAVPLRE